MIKHSDVTFRKVTNKNFEDIISLERGNEGKKHVASNCYSLIEAFFNYKIDDVRGIYYKKKLVGFLFYYRLKDTIWINRFMIDASYQNKGIGTIAFEKLIKKIIREEKPKKIELLTSNPIMESILLKKEIGFKKSVTIREKNFYKKWKEHLFVLELN